MNMSIRKIAELAGVSPATVSRALRGSPAVHPDTRARILELSDNGGYEAHRLKGSPLNTGIPAHGLMDKTIGLLLANPQSGPGGDDFFTAVVRVCAGFMKEYRGHLLVEPVGGGSDEMLPHFVLGRKVDGLLIGGIPVADAYIDRLARCAVPAVFIGKYTAGYRRLFSVLPDNYMGGYLVGKHLAACGYRECWYIGGDLSIHTFRDRLDGFRQALQEAGLDLPDQHVLIGAIDQEAGHTQAGSLLQNHSGTERIGIFAATDWLAAGVLRRLADADIQVPGGAGVVGYSDLDLARHLRPALTTVRVSIPDLAQMALHLLGELVGNRVEQPVQITLQPYLVTRESTKFAT